MGRMDFSPVINVGKYDYSFVLDGYKIGNYDVALTVTDKVNNIIIFSATLGFTVTSAIDRPSILPVPYWLIAIVIITVIVAVYFYKRRH